MADIIAFRHGECTYNADHRLNGQLDSDLTENGERQARELSVGLGQAIVDRLVPAPDMMYSSDLRRASRTGRIVADGLGLAPPLELPVLRERNLGRVAGLTYPEALALVADKHKICTPHGVTYAHAEEYGFETFAQATLRAERAHRYLELTHDTDDSVWLFTHGDFALALVAAWTGRPMEEIIQELCLKNAEAVHFTAGSDYEKLTFAAQPELLASVSTLPLQTS